MRNPAKDSNIAPGYGVLRLTQPTGFRGFLLLFYVLVLNNDFLSSISAYDDKFYRHKRLLMRNFTNLYYPALPGYHQHDGGAAQFVAGAGGAEDVMADEYEGGE